MCIRDRADRGVLEREAGAGSGRGERVKSSTPTTTGTRFTRGDLTRRVESFRGKRVLVIGDVILDRYLWGNATRVSPEAPVLVVDVDKEELRLGGAANVAQNVRALGAVPVLIGVVG